MATKKHKPEPKIKRKKLPAGVKLDSIELNQETRSYQIFAYFEDQDGGYDFELKVGKQSDLGKMIAGAIEKIKDHPKAKVR